MFAFEVHQEAFPLEGDLDDVAPAWENRHRVRRQMSQVHNSPPSNQRARHSPGEETGADHVAKHSHTAGGQAHQQWNAGRVLRERAQVNVERERERERYRDKELKRKNSYHRGNTRKLITKS